jgi:hypothetical protein
MKIIGIIGSRTRDTEKDFHKVWKKFAEVYENGDIICSGGCPKGGDRFAEIIMDRLNLPKKERIIHYPKKPPKGSPYFKYVESNFNRNTLIAKDSDILIACVNLTKDGGTEDTIKKYLKLGKNKLYKV